MHGRPQGTRLEQGICEHLGSRSPTRPFQTGHDDRSVMSDGVSFSMGEACPEPRSSNRGTDDGCPATRLSVTGRAGSRSEKTFEHGGNLQDNDAEVQSLGLKLTVEEVVDELSFWLARISTGIAAFPLASSGMVLLRFWWVDRSEAVFGGAKQISRPRVP